MLIERIDASRKENFNAFAAENGGSFLQSFEWGEFQEKTGKKIRRFLIQENDHPSLRQPADSEGRGEILAAATLILFPLPFKKTYLYCGRGPVFKTRIGAAENEKIFENFLNEIKKIGEAENAIFFKMEPPFAPLSGASDEQGKFPAGKPDENFPISSSELLKFGFKKSEKEIQPSETIILDLRKSEEELLKGMKQKTRYNIGVAEKHGIKIKENGDFEPFWRILEETAKRDKFHLHPKKYYETMLKSNLEATPPSSENKLFFAEKDGKIIAAAIVNFFGKRATYLHGASSAEHKNLMAPYLLHWEIARYAKKNGFEEYDFWGISEKKYPGVTRFKLGFGGGKIIYPGAYDLAFDKFWHLAYSVGRYLL